MLPLQDQTELAAKRRKRRKIEIRGIHFCVVCAVLRLINRHGGIPTGFQKCS